MPIYEGVTGGVLAYDIIPILKALKRAVVNVAATGDVVAAVAGKRIKVYAYAMQGQGTVNAFLRDGAVGDPLTLTWNFQTREGLVAQTTKPPTFLFATSQGNALQVVLSAAVTVGVEVSYWDDDA